MNRPDDKTLERWMDGALEGEELRQVEAWAETHAGELEQLMSWSDTSKLIKQSMSADTEPPYPDFFNTKIRQAAVGHHDEPMVAQKAPSLWQRFSWIIAPAALAGMAVCFYVGTQIHSDTPSSGSTAQTGEVYIPQRGVTAEISQAGEITVISLEGLEDIPDTLDIAAGETSIGISPRYLAKVDRDNLY
ncbi:hypothetical protein SAMN02745181_1735 [Rubritalea squalenifaciens DSM 18772]|uniref:Uncharacterized protein n=1 Tax=Rubritalea squalenifaciens DSM 18772 TaxID=1123071 RepID=A0A1M6IA42_9BACT|nr:hypothetical protein [Rubritalea squalenifaciens]SHJ31369.1 hypothetical protein SAMN02745181_1735 [Rubritalea squalenifaciens DSM 18772]